MAEWEAEAGVEEYTSLFLRSCVLELGLPQVHSSLAWTLQTRGESVSSSYRWLVFRSCLIWWCCEWGGRLWIALDCLGSRAPFRCLLLAEYPQLVCYHSQLCHQLLIEFYLSAEFHLSVLSQLPFLFQNKHLSQYLRLLSSRSCFAFFFEAFFFPPRALAPFPRLVPSLIPHLYSVYLASYYTDYLTDTGFQ